MKKEDESDPEIPLLEPEFDAAWTAWSDLSEQRPLYMGFGVAKAGPIPITAIREYMDLRGVPQRFRVDLFREIRLIDGEYLSWHGEKSR